MQFSTGCKLLLLLCLSGALWAGQNYTVQLKSRGLIFADKPQGTFNEVQLCSSLYCLFVEPRELELLGIDLGNNTTEIFTALKNMDDFDKNFIFMRIQRLNQWQNLNQ